MNKTEIKARIEFRQSALNKLRVAYLALVDGGAKSYMIDDRQLTKLDLPALSAEIEQKEKELDELEALLNSKRARKTFGIIPRDW